MAERFNPFWQGVIRFFAGSLAAADWLCGVPCAGAAGGLEDHFAAAAEVLERRCVSCHAGSEPRGGLALDTLIGLIDGGDSGPAVVAGQPEESLLIEQIVGESPPMPLGGEPLGADEIEALTRWIAAGAAWPDGRQLEDRDVPDADWWSLRPLVAPPTPQPPPAGYAIANPIDAFIAAKLAEQGLSQSPLADRRTLIRRLSFDLLGLPPTPEQIEAFVSDSQPDETAYQQLVDRFLASPRYGERWARHWLDVVHFGETHGYDKDKPRPNAWPYRDYVIRSFNSDKSWRRFTEEQLAGDVLYPETPDGIEALGFIAAGPWDFIGHAEVPESKIDGKVARHLDRDDMVANAIGSFSSLTVSCAQCHNHKFDPIPQRDYYRLQAVFSALDRSDKAYDRDPVVAARRRELHQQLTQLEAEATELENRLVTLGGAAIAQLDHRIAELAQAANGEESPRFGYHSALADEADTTKWVQVDLGQTQTINALQLVGCHDNFNDIGAGFGFPKRFKIEASDDSEFQAGVMLLVDQTMEDFPNPGVRPQRVGVGDESGQPITARYVRFTATKLAHRLPTDFALALGELAVFDAEGHNIAAGAAVTALDSIEAAPRWQRINLVDGYYFGRGSQSADELESLRSERETLAASLLDPPSWLRRQQLTQKLAAANEAQASLPPRQSIYAGTVHHGSGAFVGTGGNGGAPRPIYVLDRGSVQHPREAVEPGGLSCFPELEPWFELPENHGEGDRRAALARWLTDPRQPLTWRSIVNRVWQYHFGRGLVETPDDFGRMGATPTHPQLLDWLAADFRDHGQSLKRLHRLIVTSHTYRQVSGGPEDGGSGVDATLIDADNRWLWRANRRRLEAEAVRDAVLAVAGRLDLSMGGPSFQDFVIEHPEHSPHYQYHLHDHDDPRTARRSVYRFLVRSQPQPFMATLDCADPSMRVDKRQETLSPLQALALLNNGFMLTMNRHLAERLEREPVGPLEDTPVSEDEGTANKIRRLFALGLGRPPTNPELVAVTDYARRHGLENACRVVLNLNEFTFID